ncbi:hypothetical protein HHI36_007082 [Cryptolaemus montrouzieri]|uniref:Uncharacterized protein n=1 Tax=Cryptolaemus montrouzieri TaxID=559131 RepID=A0ABD2MNI9_9CUCU
MNYQQIPRKSQHCHPLIGRKLFYDNPEFLEESESFIDALSYSESDGYIGLPMVRSVPSHDIQELYIRKPVISSNQMLPTPQYSRCCFDGYCTTHAEYIYDLKSRLPALRPAYTAPTGQVCSRRPPSAYVSPSINFLDNLNHSKNYQGNDTADPSFFNSSPAFPVSAEARGSPGAKTKRYSVAPKATR